MIVYLIAEEILLIHARIIDATGGSHGVRDLNRIESMIARPKQQFGGKDLYETIFDKAAVYFEVPAFHHPFVDGNKRSAVTAASRFLFLNDYELTASNEELENFPVDAVVQKYDLKQIATWFENHSRKVQINKEKK